LQKEAYFFNKFCITLREETEWTELVTNGYNIIVGTDKEKIFDAINYFKGRVFEKTKSLYGGGNASTVICNHIAQKLL
jgi:UDP-GlcNAc3NAcA epimerase